MPLKLVNATELRSGSFAIIDGASCVIRNVDLSKTGKHGASKCRIEAIGVLDNKKRITVMPGSQRVAVPMIDKRRAQILNINNGTASIMDIETYETLEIAIPEDIKNEIKERKEKVEQVEYWDVEGKKIIKRIY